MTGPTAVGGVTGATPGAPRTDPAHGVPDRTAADVADVNDALLQGLDRDSVLRLVARGVHRGLDAMACAVSTLERDGTLVVRAADGRVRPDLVGTRVPVANSPAGEALRRREPVVTDSGQAGVWSGSVLGPVLVVPIPGLERPGGVIEVADVASADSSESRRFGAGDVCTAGLFAAAAGMAVEHDRVNTDLELSAAVLGAPGGEPLPETLRRLSAAALTGTGGPAAAIYLLDDNLTLRRAAGTGPTELLEDGAAGAAPNVAQAAVASRAPIVHQHVHPEGGRSGTTSPGAAQSSDGPGHGTENGAGPGADRRTTALVCVPLMSRGVVLGVLCCLCPAGSYPGRRELAYLSMVAGKAAMTVDSSHLVASAQEKAAQEERQRLARELHDSVSQALYGIALGARTARESIGQAPDRIDQPLAYVLQLAEAALADMRALIFELRPQALAEEGLVAALGKQLAAFRVRHGVRTRAVLGNEPAGAFKVKQTLYRIAQEALQNAAKHAQAHNVLVRLDASPTALTLEVADDGVGFDPGASYPGHLGLRSMRERVGELGGTLEIHSAPGKGTRIVARAPTGLWP
ncbi:GAF domain-containing protein [Actinopolymorpha singaporensis]|uniref:GAF domain-containing protein n=1 Tax=Actinopolymorpha singaporensis TaxID=117157 RepID=A0A1H1SYP6_9ACTN|nr:GAF domain-containing protein [Actinopolymorpha singaporensis]